jgi:hypothetical protein
MEHSEHVVEYHVQQEQHASQQTQAQMQHATLLATSVSIGDVNNYHAVQVTVVSSEAHQHYHGNVPRFAGKRQAASTKSAQASRSGTELSRVKKKHIIIVCCYNTTL